MSKIICDICGTSYPDTADQCPICGCAKDFKLDGAGEEAAPTMETAAPAAPVAPKTAPAKPVRPAADPVYDDEDDDDEYDDEDEDDEEYDEEEYDDDDDEDDDDDDEEEHKSNAPLVILLVVIILALLAVSAFVITRYFLPSLKPQQAQPTATQTEAPATETTELTIPCENLALTSGGEVVLDMEGANWLINVMALPENTTDKLIYTSSDETVAVVDAQGKVTAVGEGTAVITITCGAESLTCTVTVDFTPETTAPVTEPEETTEPTEAPTEAPTEPTKPLKNVDIAKSISHKELTFNGPNQGVQIRINGLNNDEVEWSTEDDKVATVSATGFITNTGKGNTYIVVKYGDQVFKIKIISK